MPNDAAGDVPPARVPGSERLAKPLRYASRYGSPDAATRLGRGSNPADPAELAGDE